MSRPRLPSGSGLLPSRGSATRRRGMSKLLSSKEDGGQTSNWRHYNRALPAN